MHYSKKFLLASLLLIFGVTLFPSPTWALDQRCWEKSKCIERRSNSVRFADQKPEDGFVQNAETLAACGQSRANSSGKDEEMGFCLPVGTTETKISLGGRRKFSDMADFIKYMYRYSIMAAGIISVLMVIVGGFQWSMSGGNSSTIESARKRINGALMGLTIAVLSYSVLNFINPNLVNFRLPGVWLINTIDEFGKYCTKVPGDKRLALMTENITKSPHLSDSKRDQLYGEAKFTVEPRNAVCGNAYFVESGEGLSCLGSFCEPGQVCEQRTSECKPGIISGKINNTNWVDPNGGIAAVVLGQWYWRSGNIDENIGWLIDGGTGKEAMQLVRICAGDLDENSFNNMTSVEEESMTVNEDKKEQYYILPASDIQGLISEAKDNCKGDGGLKGFMLEVGVHEVTPVGSMTEVHFLGQKDNRAIDLGDSDAINWVLGRSQVEALLIKPEQVLSGMIIDIDVSQIHNNEDDDESMSYYKQHFQ